MDSHAEKRIAQFWSQVDKSGGMDACWNWTRSCGFPDDPTYGQYFFGGKKMLTHRFAFQHACGEIPAGMEVCHTCDNPSCCNPRHLFLGTHRDNMQDRQRKGRGGGVNGPVRGLQADANPGTRPLRKKSGSRNGQSKLDEDDVRLIRSVYADGTMSQRQLAAEFGVHASLIGFIVRRKYWQHVE